MLLGFHYHVIHVRVYVSTYLLVQTSLHGALVCCAHIFQAKRHGNIAISHVQGKNKVFI
jgi:hypothetical protein